MAPGRRVLAIAVALYALALTLRLAFCWATADATWPYSVAFKGDAFAWLRYARALQMEASLTAPMAAGDQFELGLPLRPPAMAWLLAWLWDGDVDSLGWLRGLWCALGAVPAPLLFLGMRRHLGTGPAACAGGLLAVATGPILLSASLDNETPYLAGALGLLLALPALAAHPTGWGLAAFATGSALLTLLRVEHALTFALSAAWLGWRQRRDLAAPASRLLGRAALTALAFALPLAPWHLRAWQRLDAFNREPSNPLPEQGELPWDPGALAAVRAMPGFAQGDAYRAVEAIAAHRGRPRVEASDVAALRDAFGVPIEPLHARPFVALYGPLNFYLANHPASRGGFDRSPLSQPPPLLGGADAYPPPWRASLPLSGQLSFAYPPHAFAVNHGYALGLLWITEHPLAWLQLVGRKLARLWAGAAHGLGGSALPLGLHGTRYAVDLLVPEGTGATLWRLAVALAFAACLRPLCQRAELQPWLLWLVSKVAVAALFFGYARQGALLVPTLAVAFAAVVGTWPANRLRRGMLGLLVAVTLSDALRALRHPRWQVDGRDVDAVDPWPIDLHRDQSVVVR